MAKSRQLAKSPPLPSLFRPHPWHGLEIGPAPPEVLFAFIEITPFDLIKYEVDKQSGYLRVDRPQRGSSHPPALYGFVPRTYCGTRAQAAVPEIDPRRRRSRSISACSASGRSRAARSSSARRVVGGLQMVDGRRGRRQDHRGARQRLRVRRGARRQRPAADSGRASAALLPDLQAGSRQARVPPRSSASTGATHALKVVQAAMADYVDEFGG